jgi:phosphatidylserine/phosphatidylglycerophosphate/cardiolipin synthase-like enzyme
MHTEVVFYNIKRFITDALNCSNRDIKVAVAWLTDEDLIRILKNKAKDKLSVTVAISNSKENFCNKKHLRDLLKCGAHLYVSRAPFLHHKFCLIDSKQIINGSYNWSYSASRNQENILSLKISDDDEEDLSILKKFEVTFQNICNKNCIRIENKHALNAFGLTNDGHVLMTNADETEIALRQEFENDVKASLLQSKARRIPISTDYIIKRMSLYGDGVEFVKRIIHDENGTGEMKSGFNKLERAFPPAIELSFEYLVCKPKYETLFTDSEIAFCKKVMNRYQVKYID